MPAHQHLHRRCFLQVGASSLLGLGLPALLAGRAAVEGPGVEQGKSRSGILSAEAPVISGAKRDPSGALVYHVQSDCQDAPTKIRVLLPDRLEKDCRYAVLYVLPVDAGDGSRWGDGLIEVKKLDLHNKHGLICVMPTFARLPWYADHPTDPKIRQETYFLDVVVPFVDKTCPTLAKPEGRLLLGFSKSGWGAFTLLLRHPGRFGKAAAWDAPMAMDAPGKYGSGEIFVTRDNFAKYQVTKLLEQQAAKLGDRKRLALIGHANFRQHHEQVHELMHKLRIPHEFADGPARKHDWHSGWVADAVSFLVPKDE